MLSKTDVGGSKQNLKGVKNTSGFESIFNLRLQKEQRS